MPALNASDLFGLTTQEQEGLIKVADAMVAAAALGTSYVANGTDLWAFELEEREAIAKAMALTPLVAANFNRAAVGFELQAAFPQDEVLALVNSFQKVSVAMDASNVSPANTVAPVITGTGTVGLTLTNTTPGTWTGSPTITYARQWRRGSTDIVGATGTTYVLAAPDSGQTITVRVTATNGSGSASAISNGIAVA